MFASQNIVFCFDKISITYNVMLFKLQHAALFEYLYEIQKTTFTTTQMERRCKVGYG